MSGDLSQSELESLMRELLGKLRARPAQLTSSTLRDRCMCRHGRAQHLGLEHRGACLVPRCLCHCFRALHLRLVRS